MKNTIFQSTARKTVGRGNLVKRPRAFCFFFPFAFVLMAVTLLTACGGEATDSPEITRFEASSESIVAGDSVELTAIFSNGAGSVDHGVGAVASGEQKAVSPTETTTYTLTVTGSKLVKAISTVTVAVEPNSVAPPEIARFEASPASINKGDSAELTAVFSNGSGSIDMGVGAVNSGEPQIISPTETTTYTLTVTNSEGVETTSTATVAVESEPVAPPEIASFAASSLSIMEGDSTELTAVFSNGSGSIDNGIGEVSSEASKVIFPEETTTFTLTVTNSAGVEVTRAVTVAVEPHPISLTILEPSHNELLSDELRVAVSVESLIDIASLTASVSDDSVPLDYHYRAYCKINNPDDCEPGYAGRLSLADLPTGNHVVTVTAVDALGGSISKQRVIALDKKPVLTIAKPIDPTTVTRHLAMNVSCSDDVSDCRITVATLEKPYQLLASAVGSLTESLNLSAFDGQEVTLLIEGEDRAGHVASATKKIFVEASDALDRVKDFKHPITEFDGQRALIHISGSNGDSLEVHDIASNTFTTVEVPPGVIVSSSYLTPTGVIYQATPMNAEEPQTPRVYDWNKQILHDLGASRSSLSVAGDYAMFRSDSLWRRQFSTETTVAISTDYNYPYGFALAENGVFAYFAVLPMGYDFDVSIIVKHDTGIETVLAKTRADLGDLDHVLTDGSGFVYRKESSKSFAILFHDGVNETRLTVPPTGHPDPVTDYQINDGWVAFTDVGGAVVESEHVWTRDPTGTIERRSFFSSDTYIDTLAADGELMVITSGRRYLIDIMGEVTEVGSEFGTSIKIDGVWYVYIGRTLFKVR